MEKLKWYFKNGTKFEEFSVLYDDVEIEAESYDEASKIVDEQGLTVKQIEKNSGYWDIHEIKKSEEY